MIEVREARYFLEVEIEGIGTIRNPVVSET